MGASPARLGVLAVALVVAMLIGAPTAHATTPVQLNGGIAGDVDLFKISLDATTVVFSVGTGIYSVPIDGTKAPTKINTVPAGQVGGVATFHLSPQSDRVIYEADPSPAFGDEAWYSAPTARFFFRHTLTQGNADSEAVFGEASWLPVAGEFGL